MNDGRTKTAPITTSEGMRADVDALEAISHPETYRGISPIKVNKLGHLVYEDSDIDRSVRFWTEVMGFTVSEGNPIGMVFLRCSSDHHGIGLKPCANKRRPRSSEGMRVEHLALEVENVEILRKAKAYLEENGIPIVFEGRKGAGCNVSINFLDPDGYEFEIYCDIDQIGPSGRLRPSSQFRPAPSLEEAVANPVPKNW